MIHKLIYGGEQYLPFALSKVRQLSGLVGPNGFINNTYQINDTVIRLRVEGQHQFIRIDEGGPTYEFWTSDHILYSTLDTPGTTGYVLGSMVRAKIAGPMSKADPIFSKSLTPSATEWRLASTTEGGFSKTYGVSLTYLGQPMSLRYFPISHGAWQDQKFIEHINWPNNSGNSFVSSVQCVAPGVNSEANYISDYYINGPTAYGIVFTRLIADVLFDARATMHTSANSFSGAPDLATHGTYAWWRRSAVYTAVDGTQFFVSTDNVGRFYVYKVADYYVDIGTQIVPPSMYVQYTPPYPAWVTVPNANDRRSVQTSWLWAFNKDASKCVSCPFHSEDGANYKIYSGYKYLGYYSPAYYAALTPTEQLGYDKTRNDTPGLVEFNISITNTGPGATDFTASFTLGRVAYSGDTGGRYIFDAAYTLPDKSSTGTAMGVPEDTLVTAEITATSSVVDWTAGFTPYIRGGVRVRSNDADMVPTDVAVFPTVVFTRIGGPTSLTQYQGVGAIVFSLELRTLSWVHREFNAVTGLLTDTMTVYNQNRSVTSLQYAAPNASYDVDLGTTYLVPSASFINWSFMGCIMSLSMGAGFNIHPDGHWSYSRPVLPTETGLPRDIIHKYRGTETTHKALYNSAFKQSRDYGYYNVSWDGSAWVAPLGYDLDQGSFRTNGVWITFKKPNF